MLDYLCWQEYMNLFLGKSTLKICSASITAKNMEIQFESILGFPERILQFRKMGICKSKTFLRIM